MSSRSLILTSYSVQLPGGDEECLASRPAKKRHAARCFCESTESLSSARPTSPPSRQGRRKGPRLRAVFFWKRM
ncbi:hypothetical protein M440DRAFT_1173169 [Trichoderma longibrachiatum ATCC 18648]|uniref:Uncharacterized protein n=1 Tax=Trichoderma longibrachiatum ATCC 18648 TaxID=983965 RepID=A0A2T4CDF5_TRILO|nr:hypothetical protein M440DRAFT_1173169 [Trichoderma longibrachiatum ATCC 18648]